MVYFSSKNIEVLQPFTAAERVEIIQGAAKSMPYGRRAVAVILKLLLLIGLFWALLFVPGIIWKVVSLLAAGLLYPLLLMPVTLNLALPYISDEIARRADNKAFARQEPTPKGRDHSPQSNSDGDSTNDAGSS